MIPARSRRPSPVALVPLAFLALASVLVSASATSGTADGARSWTLTVDAPGWYAALVLAALVAAPVAWARRRRATERRAIPAPSADATPLAAPADAPVPEPVRTLAVKAGRTTILVPVADIARVEADGRYVRLFVGDRRYVASYTMAALEALLAPAGFVRVHRSTILPVAAIRRLRTDDYRDYDVELADGTTVRMSRTHRARVERALGLAQRDASS